MKPHSYTSEGIVLARRNFGEADRILIIFSKNLGRLSLLAKGIRKPKSHKRGHLEVFSLINFQASTGHGLDYMTEVEMIDDFKEIRTSLNKVSLAYYFAEIIGRITHDGETNVDLFNLILRYLNKLKKTKKLKDLRMDFILNLLTTLGFWPEGKTLTDADQKLEEVIERKIFSQRVGKRMVS
ncbi:MAG: repair protein RecO, DNA repair protein RecO (recombination protein O) protein [Microgenomates group bacterium GW2011_GWC1_39_7b]|uniref:DNA repair protein RecO n=3 Tax=Candidatus Woeseibacteriota TaxID=1752722 RepID=A0A0G0LIQ9_9BACT|nr:MAG: repair protein RecO protein [Candidatus Woesebacteria bacterium GW2011_GWB1_39_10]KKR25974.1 MAG: repair protein RecO, DNA repair protein RecO (recombination protein O) protein [Microgenomates group bacterium GW2011_GWC1_39_7b]KKR74382.1 MAG: repair protein RecO protein [Candidatus Woesebacteria bacterium GW2011_GWA2_40_7]KKS90764.1 MAG: repair protein RecO protein [Candidatus Woesebacteria bacterium GW2011_GWA1_43_12]